MNADVLFHRAEGSESSKHSLNLGWERFIRELTGHFLSRRADRFWK